MKVLVAVKRVIDPYVKIRVNAELGAVETHQIKMAMNPFDEIAVEQAIRLREKNQVNEVVVVSIGDVSSQETLRQALALGADRAILVQTQDVLIPINIAKILHKIIQDEQPNLVLMGKQSIDGDNNQSPQMLAALLSWPQATYISQLNLKEGFVEVTREIDGGLETLELQLPAVISTDLRLNEPRYATLPNIMKAKQKPMQVIELNSMDLKLKPHVEIVSVQAPKVRLPGIKVGSVQELIDKLVNEAKVL
jgi:electron transfer flavoprotein beta subunit